MSLVLSLTAILVLLLLSAPAVTSLLLSRGTKCCVCHEDRCGEEAPCVRPASFMEGSTRVARTSCVLPASSMSVVCLTIATSKGVSKTWSVSCLLYCIRLYFPSSLRGFLWPAVAPSIVQSKHPRGMNRLALCETLRTLLVAEILIYYPVEAFGVTTRDSIRTMTTIRTMSSVLVRAEKPLVAIVTLIPVGAIAGGVVR